jgi:hypothetical protein
VAVSRKNGRFEEVNYLLKSGSDDFRYTVGKGMKQVVQAGAMGEKPIKRADLPPASETAALAEEEEAYV